MPNGKDYVLFYLKLLVESVDHDGELRFSDTIPYNEQMLATITNTNIDVVRSAMKMFTELQMIDIYDNQTIYMSEMDKLLGTETYWADQKRKTRIGQCPQNVLPMSNVSNQEIELDIELDIETDNTPNNFDVFWIAYPKKVGKEAARKSFNKVKVDIQTLLSAIEQQKKAEQWIKNDGQYIPNPATWLNQGRWEDEITTKDKPIEQPKQKAKQYKEVLVNGELVMEEI